MFNELLQRTAVSSANLPPSDFREVQEVFGARHAVTVALCAL